MTRTMPDLKASPIAAMPPYDLNVFLSLKALFWAAQKSSVRLFPERPAISASELA
jgi:hypothetical protein